MSQCYVLTSRESASQQLPNDDAFLGGIPKLPPGINIPTCKFCKAEESFMFQIAFPVAHRWAGRSLAVFACTSCVHEDYLIPQMLPGQLQGANIPDGFLESYQTNFRFLVFETGSSTSCSSYREKVRFKRLSLELNADSNVRENKIGGDPNWLLGDETPKTLGGKIPMCFLLQLLPGFQFEILASAPPQAEIGLDGSSQASPLNYYQLFNGNAIYLFGTDDSNTSLVYAITQI